MSRDKLLVNKKKVLKCKNASFEFGFARTLTTDRLFTIFGFFPTDFQTTVRRLASYKTAARAALKKFSCVE